MSSGQGYCYHCGETKTRIIKHPDRSGFFSECLNCESRGPIKNTAKLAKEAWSEHEKKSESSIKTKNGQFYVNYTEVIKELNKIEGDYFAIMNDATRDNNTTLEVEYNTRISTIYTIKTVLDLYLKRKRKESKSLDF